MYSNQACDRSKIKGYDALEDLALNLHSAWNHSTDVIWRTLEPELWELSHNPWAVLQSTSKEKLEKLLADKKLSEMISDLLKMRKEILSAPTWFEENHKKSNLTTIAYFSMEFMLSEALPI